MKLKDKSHNIKKLLEYKSNSYRRKYFILSNLFNSDVLNSDRLNEEFNCYINSLNYSNGVHPDESDLISFYQECLQYSNTSRKLIESKVKFIKKYNDLRNPKNKKDINSLINESLDSINLSNKKIDKKLSNLLKESIKYKKSILIESEYVSKFVGEDEEDEMPSDQDLQDIELTDLESDMQSEESLEDENKNASFKEKVINIFGPITGGLDPAKMNKQKMARIWDFGSQEMYRPGQKGPVRDAFTEYELFIGKKLDTFTRFEDSGLSTIAQRKVWIATTIDFCLKMQKQAGYLLGVSSEDKARLSRGLDAAAKSDIKKVMQSQIGNRGFGKTLSDQEIRDVYNDLQEYLVRGQYDPENPAITEAGLFKILARASAGRNDSISDFKRTLEFMYPLTDTRAEFDKVPRMSDEELQKLGQQNIEFDKRFEDDDELEVVEEIEGEVIDVDKITSSAIGSETMTARDAEEFFKEIEKDMERLSELIEKATEKVNPEIFNELQTDTKGNVLPDIKKIPDTIPAQELTVDEIKEIEEILVKLDRKERITILNYDRRGDVYNDLIDKSVSVDEYSAYMKSFKLDSVKEPMRWRDISRSSYGKFRDTAGARQYGVKAWMKELFYSSNSDEKANIYANLAEKWFERLIVLDLIDDKSFTRMPGKTGKPEDEKIIPYNVLKDLEAKGKYKRSDKLNSITDMLELVNTYTTDPKYVKRFFDYSRDDNLDLAVAEKLESIKNYASSESEYDTLLKRLEEEDKDTAAYAILSAMFEGNSGFRYFGVGLLKEYYNQIIWPAIEINLAQAVKKYFDKHYGRGVIAASLGAGQGADDVKANEGKALFNKIIYLVMERTGISSTGSGVPVIGDSREQQRQYFLGQADPRGDFASAVNKFKAKHGSSIQGMSGPVFGPDDVNKLLDDMFSNSGIIGSEYFKLKKLSKTTSNEIITWILNYPEAKIDQAIILGMGLSDFYRRTEADPMITIAIEEIGKDTKKALADYKKKFGSLLAKGTDLADYLDEFGFDPVDLKSKGSASPGGKSFQ